MDDWLNRAGILAQGLSFLFLAPEIFGVKRSRSVQILLVSRLDSYIGYLRSFRGYRDIMKLSTQEQYVLLLGPLAPWTTAYFLSWLVVRSSVIDVIFLAGAVGLIVNGVGHLSQAWLVAWLRRRRPVVARFTFGVMTLIWLPLAMLAVPAIWAVMIVLLVPLSLIFLTRFLMWDEDSLRALVFGTGVLLLFGGMGAQLIATF